MVLYLGLAWSSEVPMRSALSRATLGLLLVSLSQTWAPPAVAAPRSITEAACAARAGHLLKIVEDYAATRGAPSLRDDQITRPPARRPAAAGPPRSGGLPPSPSGAPAPVTPHATRFEPIDEAPPASTLKPTTTAKKRFETID